MTFEIKVIGKALLQKTHARRKELEHLVSQRAIAAAAGEGLLPDMKLMKCPIDSLRKAKRRARKSDEAQVSRVMQSARTFGQRVPVLIDKKRRIIEGHIIVEALKRLGATEVWCVEIDDLTEEEKDLLHIALNRLGETGGWELEALGPLMLDLGDLGFDLSVTGFSLPEIDILTHDATVAKDDNGKADEVPDVPAVATSAVGDLWLLGKHRLLCGDSTQAENYARVLNGAKANAIFTDCPWNIPIENFVSGLGKKKHKNFKMGAGEWTKAEFITFADTFHALCAENLVEGGAFSSCSDWRSVQVIIDAGGKAGLTLINLAVWDKGSGGMGSYLRSAHELIPIFCKGSKLAVNNVELGRHGRDRTNVWRYPGANRQGSSANKALGSHPTPKSVEMVEDALLDVTNPGDLVLDPFLGSGTTLIAAQRIGRHAGCIELDPIYVDVAILRWQDLTGLEAIHADTGLTFAAMTTQRTQSDAA